jgi:hypothetical protein
MREHNENPIRRHPVNGSEVRASQRDSLLSAERRGVDDPKVKRTLVSRV